MSTIVRMSIFSTSFDCHADDVSLLPLSTVDGEFFERPELWRMSSADVLVLLDNQPIQRVFTLVNCMFPSLATCIALVLTYHICNDKDTFSVMRVSFHP